MKFTSKSSVLLFTILGCASPSTSPEDTNTSAGGKADSLQATAESPFYAQCVTRRNELDEPTSMLEVDIFGDGNGSFVRSVSIYQYTDERREEAEMFGLAPPDPNRDGEETGTFPIRFVTSRLADETLEEETLLPAGTYLLTNSQQYFENSQRAWFARDSATSGTYYVRETQGGYRGGSSAFLRTHECTVLEGPNPRSIPAAQGDWNQAIETPFNADPVDLSMSVFECQSGTAAQSLRFADAEQYAVVGNSSYALRSESNGAYVLEAGGYVPTVEQTLWFTYDRASDRGVLYQTEFNCFWDGCQDPTLRAYQCIPR